MTKTSIAGDNSHRKHEDVDDTDIQYTTTTTTTTTTFTKEMEVQGNKQTDMLKHDFLFIFATFSVYSI